MSNEYLQGDELDSIPPSAGLIEVPAYSLIAVFLSLTSLSSKTFLSPHTQ